MLRRGTNTLIYPRQMPGQDALEPFALQLIELALGRSGSPWRLERAAELLPQARALLELAKPQPALDLMWAMTGRDREQRLLPIRIPIDRGLLGWRLPLVQGQLAERFASVQRLRDLAAFSAVQMTDWPDTQILRANGLPVETASRYEGLFAMLMRGRADYLPRSIAEIDAELEARRGQGLVIAPNLLLHYRAPMYFFVAPTRPELAEALRQGLEAMLADGSFERLFQQRFAGLMERHQLDKRQVLRLHNPDLSPETPLERRQLWVQPPVASGLAR